MRNSNRILLILAFLFLIQSNIQSQNLTKEFPVILQENPLDCGPVCLQMIAEYYDKKSSVKQISVWAELDSTGTSLFGLSNAADSLNLKTLAVKIPFIFLVDDAPLPAIVHWNGNHFVVVYKANRRKVWVADPAYGKRIYSKEEFQKYWLKGSNSEKQEGIVLFLEPNSKN